MGSTSSATGNKPSSAARNEASLIDCTNVEGPLSPTVPPVTGTSARRSGSKTFPDTYVTKQQRSPQTVELPQTPQLLNERPLPTSSQETQEGPSVKRQKMSVTSRPRLVEQSPTHRLVGVQQNEILACAATKPPSQPDRFAQFKQDMKDFHQERLGVENNCAIILRQIELEERETRQKMLNEPDARTNSVALSELNIAKWQDFSNEYCNLLMVYAKPFDYAKRCHALWQQFEYWQRDELLPWIKCLREKIFEPFLWELESRLIEHPQVIKHKAIFLCAAYTTILVLRGKFKELDQYWTEYLGMLAGRLARITPTKNDASADSTHMGEPLNQGEPTKDVWHQRAVEWLHEAHRIAPQNGKVDNEFARLCCTNSLEQHTFYSRAMLSRNPDVWARYNMQTTLPVLRPEAAGARNPVETFEDSFRAVLMSLLQGLKPEEQANRVEAFLTQLDVALNSTEPHFNLRSHYLAIIQINALLRFGLYDKSLISLGSDSTMPIRAKVFPGNLAHVPNERYHMGKRMLYQTTQRVLDKLNKSEAIGETSWLPYLHVVLSFMDYMVTQHWSTQFCPWEDLAKAANRMQSAIKERDEPSQTIPSMPKLCLAEDWMMCGMLWRSVEDDVSFALRYSQMPVEAMHSANLTLTTPLRYKCILALIHNMAQECAPIYFNAESQLFSTSAS